MFQVAAVNVHSFLIRGKEDRVSKVSGFECDPKNPSPLWIIWINNPFLDFSKETIGFKIQIWILAKKRILSINLGTLRTTLNVELRGVTLSKIMTNSEQKLRKANKELKDEVAELKMKLEKVLKGVILERKNFITYLGLLGKVHLI